MSCNWWRNLSYSLLLLALPGLLAQGRSEERKPEVTRAVRHSLSPPWREIPQRPQPPGPNRQVPNKKPGIVPGQQLQRDPLVDFQQQLDPGYSAPAQIVGTFRGLSDDDNAAILGSRSVPPDTVGDVGGSYYVQMINRILAVYDKQTGARVFGPVANNSIWDGFGGPCDLENDGDPIVFYDHLAGRWVLSQFAINGGNGYQCVAVSQTSDPAGAYHLYEYLITPGGLNDYPKIGLWPDGYYMSVNEFVQSPSGWVFQGTKVVAFERQEMLVGGDARALYSTTGNASLQPAHLEGPPPTVAGPNTFLTLSSGSYRLWEFHADWDNTSNSSFTYIGYVLTDSFDSSVYSIPQPAPGELLDSLAGRAMYPAQYRDFGSHQTIVFNHTVDVGGNRAGIRWVELRKSGGNWGLEQTGTFAPDGTLHYWMASAGMDGAGNMALGYSVSGTELEPSVRYTSRQAGDPLDVMTGGETDIQVGTGVQVANSYNRWGDYSSISVDSEDDCTFYYTQEYYENDASFDFKTVVGSFRLPDCAPAPGCDLNSDCDDANPCTTDSCTSGTCSYTGVTCDDQDACTLDSCDPGSGCVNEPLNCDDGDACTVDSCDTANGCYYEAVTCSDGEFCNGLETCDPVDGCQAGTAPCPGAQCDEVNDVCEGCDNDGICESGEDCDTCPGDCLAGESPGAVCGNQVCEAGSGEDCLSCPADCNGVQTGKPANRYCCGPDLCGDPVCNTGGNTCSLVPVLAGSYCCGQNGCEPGESSANCALDCGADPCGDSFCDSSIGETCSTCEADCGPCQSVDCSLYSDKWTCNAQATCRWDNKAKECIAN